MIHLDISVSISRLSGITTAILKKNKNNFKKEERPCLRNEKFAVETNHVGYVHGKKAITVRSLNG